MHTFNPRSEEAGGYIGLQSGFPASQGYIMRPHPKNQTKRQRKRDTGGTSEVAQWLRELAAKPDNLSLIT